MAANTSLSYKICGIDDVLYGPVDLPVLMNWVRDDRVTSDTWVYTEADDSWRKAKDIPELRSRFDDTIVLRNPNASDTSLIARAPNLKPGALRRIRVFAGLSDEQLSRLVKYMELRETMPFEEVVRQGTPGDALYLILQGEVRVRMMVAGKETTLATLGAGEFFGEISLFDHGPRSADVISNTEAVLLRFSAAAFEKVVQREPDLAAPFLLGMGKTLTNRIRAGNKKWTDTIGIARGVQ